jgi:pimeloyl-ACP methyl ester carboxylesterase
MTPSFLDTAQGRRIAYHQTSGHGTGVVFLGGFKSDMDGTKAIHLEDWAKANDRPFLRLDYSGHGQSSGEFLDGSIGDWAQDAQAAIEALTGSPQIIIGSSMGGWIALLMAKRIPDRVAALIGIAAAPDFTEDSMWSGFSTDQRAQLETEGQVALPSDYSDEPYIITKRLIEDGRNQLVLRDPLSLPCPVRLFQGTQDTDVDQSLALRLLDHMDANDAQLNLIKGADHRFSEPPLLAMITDAIESLPL